MTIGDFLTEARKKAGYTQATLSKLAGVSQSTLSDVENNTRELSVSNFISICNALRIPPSDALASILAYAPQKTDILPPVGVFTAQNLTPEETELLHSLVRLLPSRQVVEASGIQAPVHGLAAAGGPIIDVDYDEDETITINPKYLSSQYLIIRAKGESMVPKINDGDHIIVQRYVRPFNGDIALVYVNVSNGSPEYSIKKYYSNNGMVKLVSINEDYSPIIVPLANVISAEKVIDIIHK